MLARDGELGAGHRLGADLERHLLRVVDEDAVAPGGPEERHILVRLIAAGAAVGVPDVDLLAVFATGPNRSPRP